MVLWVESQLEKKLVCGINLDVSTVSLLAACLNCKVDTMPFFYLGLPLGGNPKFLGLWQLVQEKIVKN